MYICHCGTACITLVIWAEKIHSEHAIGDIRAAGKVKHCGTEDECKVFNEGAVSHGWATGFISHTTTAARD